MTYARAAPPRFAEISSPMAPAAASQPDRVGLDHADLGRAARARGGVRADCRLQPWARWFAIVVVSLKLLRPARLSRQQQLPALGADCPGVERDRALRADCTLEREPVRSGARAADALSLARKTCGRWRRSCRRGCGRCRCWGSSSRRGRQSVRTRENAGKGYPWANGTASELSPRSSFWQPPPPLRQPQSPGQPPTRSCRCNGSRACRCRGRATASTTRASTRLRAGSTSRTWTPASSLVFDTRQASGHTEDNRSTGRPRRDRRAADPSCLRLRHRCAAAVHDRQPNGSCAQPGAGGCVPGRPRLRPR